MFIQSCFYLLHVTVVLCYSHQKPLPQKLWSERCARNSIALNDCNWCWCDMRQKFQCKARVCEEVDMFGHFKDAIRDIDVGMEGHGSWRSSMTPCSPGVHYRRGEILCLCDEDGNWPNPVCRDIFRVLHTVQIYQDAVNQTCTPSKLYLIGCNVCFCSSSGYLNPELCTKKECEDDDPALPQNRPKDQSKYENTSEVYAKCDSDETYELGCRQCICLRNNRLICNDCSNEQTPVTMKNLYRKRKRKDEERKRRRKRIKNTKFGLCEGKYPKENFELGCSTCFCDRYFAIYCSVQNCLKPIRKLKSHLKLSNTDQKIVNSEVKYVEPPIYDDLCHPNTKYLKGCNECICLKLENDVKIFDCSLRRCSALEGPSELIQNNCVVGKVYMMDCRICYCYTIDGVKHQICHANAECKNIEDELGMGYCIPLRIYRKDCNTCKCLSDGKTLMCTAKYCAMRSSQPLTVDLVPVQMMNNDPCPKGSSYKLDCNLCFCLSNGNAICTTMDCSNGKQEV